MSRLSEHHEPKCGIEGKCSVPMWSYGSPSGFCDHPAWGQQYTPGSKYAPPHWSLRDRNGYYINPHNIPPCASGYCCEDHGGPRQDQIRFIRDGNMWCAFRPDFVNLAESLAGFSETQSAAEKDLLRLERTDTGLPRHPLYLAGDLEPQPWKYDT